MPYLHKNELLDLAQRVVDDARLTQEEVAERLGKSQASISRALGSDASRDWTPLRVEIIRVIGGKSVDGPYWKFWNVKRLP